MDPTTFTESPFAVLTFIAAPALLTNATSVLALSTTNRMLRTRDAMSALLAKSEAQVPQGPDAEIFVRQVNRVESQAGLMLGALGAIYLALGSFAGATLVTLLGAALSQFRVALWLALVGVTFGTVGVSCLILGSIRLFQATQLSLINIREEAKLIRARNVGKQ